jgi:predicted metal-dependent hydrolase
VRPRVRRPPDLGNATALQLGLPFASFDSGPAPDEPRASSGRPAPPVPAPSVRDDEPYVVHYVRNRRARRYVLRLRPDGSVRVTMPMRGSRREAHAFVERCREWIGRQRRREVEKRCAWADGTPLLLRGVPTRVLVQPAAVGLRIVWGDVETRATGADEVRVELEAALRARAAAELPGRVSAFAERLGLTIGRVTIRNQRTRWGSCSSSGAISLNWRLLQMPAAVADYIILHELMHLKQPNHSRGFWVLVAEACPGYRKAERWLRRHTHDLL